MNKVYVFGVHSRGQTTATYLEYESDIEVIGFLYDNDEINPLMVNNKPVYNILNKTESERLNFSCPVYIGTRGVHFATITNNLKKIGFMDIRPVTVELDILLRTNFLTRLYDARGLTFEKLNVNECIKENEERLSYTIFVAVSSTDKELEEIYCLQEYEEVIQVGASLIHSHMESVMNKSIKLYDDDGIDNISNENRRLCELTGIYYIWKNIFLTDMMPDIIGYCHYRRHFLLPVNWQNKFCGENAIDVILATPLLVQPSLAENFKFRHYAAVWDELMRILKEKYPYCYGKAVEFFDNGLYSPCNMFITRKEIFNNFCEWVFPILFTLLDKIGEIDNPYQNRYAAFVSERLMSFYFHFHFEKYKIVYADKNFLS